MPEYNPTVRDLAEAPSSGFSNSLVGSTKSPLKIDENNGQSPAVHRVPEIQRSPVITDVHPSSSSSGGTTSERQSFHQSSPKQAKGLVLGGGSTSEKDRLRRELLATCIEVANSTLKRQRLLESAVAQLSITENVLKKRYQEYYDDKIAEKIRQFERDKEMIQELRKMDDLLNLEEVIGAAKEDGIEITMRVKSDSRSSRSGRGLPKASVGIPKASTGVPKAPIGVTHRSGTLAGGAAVRSKSSSRIGSVSERVPSKGGSIQAGQTKEADTGIISQNKLMSLLSSGSRTNSSPTKASRVLNRGPKAMHLRSQPVEETDIRTWLQSQEIPPPTARDLFDVDNLQKLRSRQKGLRDMREMVRDQLKASRLRNFGDENVSARQVFREKIRDRNLRLVKHRYFQEIGRETVKDKNSEDERRTIGAAETMSAVVASGFVLDVLRLFPYPRDTIEYFFPIYVVFTWLDKLRTAVINEQKVRIGATKLLSDSSQRIAFERLWNGNDLTHRNRESTKAQALTGGVNASVTASVKKSKGSGRGPMKGGSPRKKMTIKLRDALDRIRGDKGIYRRYKSFNYWSNGMCHILPPEMSSDKLPLETAHTILSTLHWSLNAEGDTKISNAMVALLQFVRNDIGSVRSENVNSTTGRDERLRLFQLGKFLEERRKQMRSLWDVDAAIKSNFFA